MASRLKNLVKRALGQRGLAVVPADHFAQLQQAAVRADKSQRLSFIADSRLRLALDLLPESQSQLNQDFFALEQCGWKRDGYFVEFGATDGRTLSNSWLLERHFGWRGILAEPARGWRKALESAGRTAALDFDCVWSASGEMLAFSETDWAEISTVSAYRHSDHHDRGLARNYSVRTVSLADLLARHGAPPAIDYLSIDTEGSEFAILEAFDFAAYTFASITVEHNHTPMREQLHALLTGHGYRRVHEDLSDFDDWYVPAG